MTGWQPIETAPKDGTMLLLWVPSPLLESGGCVEIGSFREDEGFVECEGPMWLDNSFDDFSCGYASRPLKPSHWMEIPEGPES